jgi:hypothetical protein
MNPKIMLRIAALTVVFFAFGHSIGHFTRKASTDSQAIAVFKAMEGYKFPIGSQFRSYDEFYEGMSLNLIITLLTMTAMLWILSGVAVQQPGLCLKLLWPLLLCLLAFSATGWRYFFLVPATTCVVAAFFIIGTMRRLKKEVSGPA